MRYAAKVVALDFLPAAARPAALQALRAEERAELAALKARELAKRYAAAARAAFSAQPPQADRPIKTVLSNLIYKLAR